MFNSWSYPTIDQARQPHKVVSSLSLQVFKQRLQNSLLEAMDKFLHKVGFGLQSPGALPNPEPVFVFGKQGMSWISGFQTVSADSRGTAESMNV